MSDGTQSYKNYVNLHAHSHYSLLDGFSKIPDMVSYCKEQGYRAVSLTDHGVLSGCIELFQECKKQGLKPILGCLLYGQHIRTVNGIKEVQDIQTGDLVYTHLGNLKPVLGTMTKKHAGNLYTIHLSGKDRTLKITGEHPVLIYDGVDKRWIKVEDIKYGRIIKTGGLRNYKSYVCCPKIYGNTTSINIRQFVSGFEYSNNKFYKKLKNNKYYKQIQFWEINENLELTNDFCYFIGLFLSEGSFDRLNGKLTGGMRLTFNINEIEYINFCQKFLLDIFNIKSTLHTRRKKNITEITFCNIIFAQILNGLCGSGAKNKHIHSIFFQAPLSLQESLLNGLCDGDGKKISKTNITKQKTFKVSSKNLAHDFQQLIINFGHYNKVSKIINENKISYSVSYSPFRGFERSLHDDKYVYIPIKNITSEKIETNVYNFEVKDDNSYISDYALHNCELYVCDGNANDKNSANRGLSHLVVLCKNLKGWHELIQLVSESNKPENFYYKPRVDYAMLKKYLGNGNHVGISGHPGSTLADQIFSNPKVYNAKNIDEARLFLPSDWKDIAKNNIDKHIDIFGNNFFVEIQLIDKDRLYMAQVLAESLREVAKENNYNVVATADSHYVRKTDAIYQRILLCSSLGLTLPKVYADLRSNREVPLGGFFLSDNYHIPTFDEMSAIHTEEELSNAVLISDMCENYNILSKPKLPRYQCLNGQTEVEYIKELVEDGWKNKVSNTGKDEKIYSERIKEELNVIEEADLSGYFLIVWDIIEYMRKNGWMTPTGRGSAAGCLTSYLIGIVSIDAIKHDLLFERFFNAGRKGSLPDIDIDVQSEHREEIIQYIKNKYGSEYVSQMATFGALMGRSAIKEVLRAEGFTSFAEVNEITEFIPDEAEIADELQEMENPSIIMWTLENRPKKLSKWCTLKEDGSLDGPLAQSFIKAIKIEGTYKSQGKHAAGVIISSEKLSDICPMIRDKDGNAVAGLSMQALEALGLVKFDVLAVNVMDKVHEIIPFLPEGCDINDLEDSSVWDDLSEGDVKGVFQLELQKRWAKKLKPRNIDHLAALVSIIRPGVVEAIENGKSMTEHYIDRKNLKDDVPSIHEIIDPILENTYGIIVYQENAMKLAKEIAGFDLKQADDLRKAIGKKIVELMLEVKQKFLNGCKATAKVPEEIYTKIFDWIEKSQRYSFNASHAYSYAYNAYFTAYCKHYAPLKFYEVYLNHSKNKPDTIKEMRELINDAKLHNINVYGPSLSRFVEKFTLDKNDNSISFGISNIKEVGAEAKKFLKIKNEMGESFALMSWPEILINTLNINKKAMRALISTGALNGPNNKTTRNQMLYEFEIFRSLTDREIGFMANNLEKDKNFEHHITKIINGCKIAANRLKVVNDLKECVQNPTNSLTDTGFWISETERNYMGLSLTGDVVESLDMSMITSNCMDVRMGITTGHQTIAATITNVKEITIKKEGSKMFGQQMAFLSLEDTSGEFNNVTVFPELYKASKTMIVKNNTVVVSGNVESRNGEFSLIADRILQI